MKPVISRYKELHPIIRFAINGTIFFILWLFFYHSLRYTNLIDPLYNKASQSLTAIVLNSSKHILNLLGYQTAVRDTLIYIVDAPKGIDLLRGCLGRNLMGIFTGLIIAFPGEWKNKIWYIPLGIFFIIIINIIRVIALVYNANCCPESTQFNHDVFFNYSIYALTFIMWVIWVQYFSPVRKNRK